MINNISWNNGMKGKKKERREYYRDANNMKDSQTYGMEPTMFFNLITSLNAIQYSPKENKEKYTKPSRN